jgi:hypothetical protein
MAVGGIPDVLVGMVCWQRLHRTTFVRLRCTVPSWKCIFGGHRESLWIGE